MRTKESIIEEIIQFFKDNKSVFTTAIEELDDCNENGYLGDTCLLYTSDAADD